MRTGWWPIPLSTMRIIFSAGHVPSFGRWLRRFHYRAFQATAFLMSSSALPTIFSLPENAGAHVVGRYRSIEMDDFVLARVLHVLAIIPCIGGENSSASCR